MLTMYMYPSRSFTIIYVYDTNCTCSNKQPEIPTAALVVFPIDIKCKFLFFSFFLTCSNLKGKKERIRREKFSMGKDLR